MALAHGGSAAHDTALANGAAQDTALANGAAHGDGTKRGVAQSHGALHGKLHGTETWYGAARRAAWRWYNNPSTAALVKVVSHL